VRGEGGAIDYSWGTGSRVPGLVDNDTFSVRWNRAVHLEAGLYRFRVVSTTAPASTSTINC
jgi:hypothetical protein